MRSALWKKLRKDADGLLDIGQIENLKEMRDIRHVLLTLVEI